MIESSPRPSLVPSREGEGRVSEVYVRGDAGVVAACVDDLRQDHPELDVVVRLFRTDRAQTLRSTYLAYARGRLADPERAPTVRAEFVEQWGVSEVDLARVGLSVSAATTEFVGTQHQCMFPISIEGRFEGLAVAESRTPIATATERYLARMFQHLGRELTLEARVHDTLTLRDQLDRVFELASTPIAVVSVNRRILSVNQRLAMLVHADGSSLTGQDAWRIFAHVSEEDRARVREAFAKAQAGATVAVGEIRFHLEAPQRISFVATPLTDRNGSVSAIVFVGQDKTDVHLLEQQVQRTEKLATIGQLVAGVVHELNNPLTSISVYSEYLLGKGTSAPEDQKKLEKIHESAQRMLRFSRELVSFARPSSDAASHVQVAGLVTECIGFCEPVLAEALASVELQIPDGLEIYGVRGQLQQVMVNLITNGCHAVMQQVEGAPRRIHIEARLDGGEVVLYVDDTGPGIADGLAARVFEPFFSTKPEGKGTGLGLSIVRNIVDGHGGRVQAENLKSAPWRTRFCLRFPNLAK